MNFSQFDSIGFEKANRALAHLSQSDTLSLQQEVLAWDTQALEPANKTLFKYYRVTVPEPLLKQVLSEDLSLAYEVHSNSVSDTHPREILMDSVLKKINVPSWPHNGMDEAKVNEFADKFYENGKAAGLTYQPVVKDTVGNDTGKKMKP